MLSPKKQRAMVRGPASLWFSGLRRHAAAMAERRVVWLGYRRRTDPAGNALLFSQLFHVKLLLTQIYPAKPQRWRAMPVIPSEREGSKKDFSLRSK